MAENIENVKVYQDLTFEALDKMIRAECAEGKSILDTGQYSIGMSMIKYLERRGFRVYSSGLSGRYYISW